MRYFVIWPDGQRFGPASEEELAIWLKEGRVTLDMEAEAEATGHRLKLGELEAVKQAAAEMPRTQETQWQAPPTGPAAYYRSGMQVGQPLNNSDVQMSWVLSGIGLGLGVISFCCCGIATFGCPVLPIFGLIMANKANAKGATGASSAKIFAICAIVITALIALGYLALMVGMFAVGSFGSNGKSPFMP